MGLKHQSGIVLIWVLIVGGLTCVMTVSMLQISLSLTKSGHFVQDYQNSIYELEHCIAHASRKFFKQSLKEQLSSGKWIGFAADTLTLFDGGRLFFTIAAQDKVSHKQIEIVDAQWLDVLANKHWQIQDMHSVQSQAHLWYTNSHQALFPWLDYLLEKPAFNIHYPAQAVGNIYQILLLEDGVWQNYELNVNDNTLQLIKVGSQTPLWTKPIDTNLYANPVAVRDKYGMWGVLVICGLEPKVQWLDATSGQLVQTWPIALSGLSFELVPLDLHGQFYMDAFLIYGRQGNALLCHIQGGCKQLSNLGGCQDVVAVRGRFGPSLIQKSCDPYHLKSQIQRHDLKDYRFEQDWSMSFSGPVSDLAVKHDKLLVIAYHDAALHRLNLKTGSIEDSLVCKATPRDDSHSFLTYHDLKLYPKLVAGATKVISCFNDNCFECPTSNKPERGGRTHWKLKHF